MRISDWSSDVCSSDLLFGECCTVAAADVEQQAFEIGTDLDIHRRARRRRDAADRIVARTQCPVEDVVDVGRDDQFRDRQPHLRRHIRSEEHTSELQSLMRISYAVFCLQKKTYYNNTHKLQYTHQQLTIIQF